MRKVRLHTTISPETYRKIEELKGKYRTVSAVIEAAIDNLIRMEEDRLLSQEDLALLRFVRELNFTLCAKDHYTRLVEGFADKAVQESMIEMAIKYISKKPLSQLSLEEFLENVKKLWTILNRGEHMEIQRFEDSLNFVFYHDMRSVKVSEIHLELIRYVYEKYYSGDYSMQVDAITVNGFSLIFRKRLAASL